MLALAGQRGHVSVGRPCLVARELAPVTRGGIGEAIRGRLEAEIDAMPPVVLLDLPTGLVRRARAGCPERVTIRGVEELAPAELPLHVFRSEAYWRSHRIWLALRALREELVIDTVEFPDYEGLGFVSIKAARLGLDANPPAMWVRIHGTAEWTARADGRKLASLEERQRARMERYALRHADTVVAPSRAIAEAYREDYDLSEDLRVDRPIKRLPTGMGEGATRLAVQGLPLVIGFLGKLQPLKGADVLIEAAVELMQTAPEEKRLEVHLVGRDERGRWGPSHLAELKARIPAELTDQFVFHGNLSRERALAQLAACHAAVAPSRMETFGLAVHELASIGLPLALSDIPAFRGDFESVEGVELFPVDDVSRLREILGSWLGALERGTFPPARRNRDERASDGLEEPPPRVLENLPSSPPATQPILAPKCSSTGVHPRVSIIVPFFEMQAYVDDCLESIASTDFRSLEVLIIDDGSRSPASCTKLESLRRRAASDPGLRVLSKANGGLGSARNFGVHYARGDLLLFLDSDDRIAEGYLEAATKALDRCPELAFVSPISSLFPDGSEPESAGDWIVPYDPDLAMLFYENGAGTSASVFRREIFDHFRYREDLPAYEDWDLHLQLAAAGREGEVLPFVFHHYRQRPSGLSRLAHNNHDRLLATILAPHLEGADPSLRGAFEIYLASVTRLRGLGDSRAGDRASTRWLADAVESFYRRKLKMWLSRTLSDDRRDRIVGWGRRLLRGD